MDQAASEAREALQRGPRSDMDSDVFGIDRVRFGPDHPIADGYNAQLMDGITTASALHPQQLGDIPSGAVPTTDANVKGPKEEGQARSTAKAPREAEGQATHCEITT